MVIDQFKYYPDRFYLRLEEFDLNKLGDFKFYKKLDLNHFAFIHEYYHYLNNIQSFSGIRQFHLNFCDRFRIVNNLANSLGIDAFPIAKNDYLECKEEIEYYNKINSIIHLDDLDTDIVSTINKDDFKIVDISTETGSILNKGQRSFYRIKVDTGFNQLDFRLNYGVIDEVFCSLIDEFLFRNDYIDDDVKFIKKRPAYPYQLHEKLFNYYGLRHLSIPNRVLIIAHSLNDRNPSIKLVDVLNEVSMNKQTFEADPFNFLQKQIPVSAETNKLLNAINQFITETSKQGRTLISTALQYYYDIFYIANSFKENDPYFFIRPILDSETKEEFLDKFQRIYKIFNPPLILQDQKFHVLDNITHYPSSTLLIIGTYEVFESLKHKKFAKRPDYLKSKYHLNDMDDDNYKKFGNNPPKEGRIFQLALNELSLYKIYLENGAFV
jgi:hypothetical protein